ncbi:MAG: hypothetical protein WC196_05435 [Bacilli bacterium]
MTRKMLFIYVGQDNVNMIFCDGVCDDCPIKFTCFTCNATAFNVTVDKQKKRIVECIPYYAEETAS